MNLQAELERIAEGRGSQVSEFSLREVAAEALREVAALREALGSLQELLAKQIAVPEGDDILCAACGLANDAHTERCPVARGLAIIDAALKPHAQGGSV